MAKDKNKPSIGQWGTTAAETKKRMLSEAWKKNVELALLHKSKKICKWQEKQTNK